MRRSAIVLLLVFAAFAAAKPIETAEGISSSGESEDIETEYVDELQDDAGDGSGEDGSGTDDDDSDDASEPVYRDGNQTLHRLINTEPIESFILRAPRFNRKKKYEVVVLVISAEQDKDTRREIRREWASKKESKMQNSGNSLVLFLIGRSSYLDEEADIYGDLLQVDIEETYRNLVYKIEVGFRWLVEKAHFNFMAKVDSDTVLHIDRLVNRLQIYRKELYEADISDHWLACRKHQDRPVHRDEKHKWYVSYDDYSNDNFPTYCNGPGYAMKKSTLAKIMEKAKDYDIFEVEDAFFTGVVANDDEIKPLFVDGRIASSQYTEYSECDSNSPVLSFLNTDAQFNDDHRDLADAWQQLKKPKCHTWLSRVRNL